MYGAGLLERRNIGEYVDAARFAQQSGHGHLADELLTMAEVEWDHEQYFREKVASHTLGRNVPMWSAPPPRGSLREGLRQRPSGSHP